MASVMAPPDKPTLSNLPLPPEIRLMIYTIIFKLDVNTTVIPSQEPQLSTQILRVCRSISREALPLLYNKYVFMIMSYVDASCVDVSYDNAIGFFRKIGLSNLGAIRHLSLQVTYFDSAVDLISRSSDDFPSGLHSLKVLVDLKRSNFIAARWALTWKDTDTVDRLLSRTNSKAMTPEEISIHTEMLISILQQLSSDSGLPQVCAKVQCEKREPRPGLGLREYYWVWLRFLPTGTIVPQG
jgi:hypothetical protein